MNTETENAKATASRLQGRGATMKNRKFKLRVRTSTSVLAIAALVSAPVTQAWADISNSATVSGSFGATTVNAGPATVDIPVEAKTATVQLYKTVSSVTDNGASGDSAGDVINYDFVITNTGNVTLTNLEVTDPLVGTIDYGASDLDANGSVDTLAPGASVTVTGSYTVQQADIDAGYFENSAVVNALDPQLLTVSDTSDAGDDATETANGAGTTDGDATNDPTVNTFTQTSSLVATKSDTLNAGGNGIANAGETITYTITVANTGNTTLTNVALVDTLTNGASTGLSLDAAPTLTAGDDGDGELDVGETWTYTATYTLQQADIESGSVSNTLTVNADTPGGGTVSDVSDDPDEPLLTGNDDPTVTTIAPSATLSFAKVGNITAKGTGNTGTDAEVGDTITYTYTIQNTGNVSVTGITVTDVHEGVTLVSSAVASSAAGPFDETSAGPNSSDAATDGIWDSLYPGETVTFTYTHTVTQAEFDNQ